MRYLVLCLLALLLPAAAETYEPERVLFVLTSHGVKGETTGDPTGFYLSEVSHPYEILSKAGYEIDFVSPKGGRPPVDGLKLDDPTNRAFWENPARQRELDRTMTPDKVNASNYVAIFFAGGHGTMWDFANDERLAALAAQIYDAGGVVAAVCHGPAGILNIKRPDGGLLIEGREVTGFSNEEEEAARLTEVVPYLLEDELKARGALYSKAEKFQKHCVTSDRLITGQNPASASAVGEEIVRVLSRPKE